MQSVPRQACPRAGFTLIELMSVIVLIGILSSLLVPAFSKSRETGRNAVCKSNMRQLTLGMVMYAMDDRDYLPWAGDVDRNFDPDWVFGGQPNGDTTNTARWKLFSYGFHPEAGSIFTHVTSLPRVERTRFFRGGSPTAYEREGFFKYFKVYNCPSAGKLGRALRVTYSLNGLMDTNAVTPQGIQQSLIINPSQKILLVNEDPRAMHNASFYPSGPADSGAFVMHHGKINMAFTDGHVEPMRNKLVQEIQGVSTRASLLYFDPYYK